MKTLKPIQFALLCAAALLNSTAGMFWSNVLLVPSILFWLAGVALREARS